MIERVRKNKGNNNNNNKYLNKKGCIIDSLMWVFCKSNRVK